MIGTETRASVTIAGIVAPLYSPPRNTAVAAASTRCRVSRLARLGGWTVSRTTDVLITLGGVG